MDDRPQDPWMSMLDDVVLQAANLAQSGMRPRAVKLLERAAERMPYRHDGANLERTNFLALADLFQARETRRPDGTLRGYGGPIMGVIPR